MAAGVRSAHNHPLSEHTHSNHNRLKESMRAREKLSAQSRRSPVLADRAGQPCSSDASDNRLSAESIFLARNGEPARALGLGERKPARRPIW
jgi:hypothetical protein